MSDRDRDQDPEPTAAPTTSSEETPALPPAEPTERIGSSDAEKKIALAGSGGTDPTMERKDVTEDDEEERSALRALDTDEIRARRRPRTIFLVWAWELACALFIAVPIHAWARRAWGAHPDGDAELFKPGGHALLAWLGDEGPPLAIVTRTTFVTLIILAVLGQIVTAALIASLSTGIGKEARPPRAAFTLGAGASAFFPMIGIGVLAGAVEGFVFGVGYFVSSSLDHALENRLGDARSFTVRLVVLALFVLLMLMVGVIADLGRVVIARNAALGIGASDSMLRRLRHGIIGGIRTARGWIGRATIAWGWRAAISVSLIYVGSIASDAVGARGAGALWALFFFHQLLMLVRTGLRASWLANALRLVTRSVT